MMETNTNFVNLSENEFVIKDYRCTKSRRILGSSSTGILSVTNKRLVYYIDGKSINGSNTLISEMPLEDVAGISTSLSVSLSWIMFIIVSFILYFGTSIVTSILPDFLTGWVISIILVLPYLINLMFEKNILNSDLKKTVNQKLDQSPVRSWIEKKDSSFYTRLFYILFYVGIALIAWNLVHRTKISYQAPFFGFLILLASYFLIFIIFFGKSRSFSVQIASKTAKSNGIYIPGNFLASLISGLVPFQSMRSKPDQDAEVMIKELGAIIIDIQQLGDLGIKKWMDQVI